MSFDGMRVGGGRLHPILVCLLIFACIVLVCNWWSLSAKNMELLQRIDDLSLQFKISAEEKNQCVMLRGNLEQRYKRLEDEVATLHIQLKQEKELQKKNEETAIICNSKLDSLNRLDATKTATIETLRLEKDTINGQLEERKEENKRLQDKFEIAQDEISKLKLTLESLKEKQAPAAVPEILPKAAKPGGPHLGLVPENAVKVSSPGQQGMKYHGIPVLPQDPPNAVRQLPQLSVTMLKAAGNSSLNNETQNGGNHETQNALDGRISEPAEDRQIEQGGNQINEETLDDNAREQEMTSTMDLEEKETVF